MGPTKLAQAVPVPPHLDHHGSDIHPKAQRMAKQHKTFQPALPNAAIQPPTMDSEHLRQLMSEEEVIIFSSLKNRKDEKHFDRGLKLCFSSRSCHLSFQSHSLIPNKSCVLSHQAVAGGLLALGNIQLLGQLTCRKGSSSSCSPVAAEIRPPAALGKGWGFSRTSRQGSCS